MCGPAWRSLPSRSLPDGTYRVSCPGESHTARQLVLAAGAWCGPLGQMLGLRIPVKPVRGQMWATEALTPRLFHSLSGAESPAHWSASPGNDSETPPDLTHVKSRRVTRHLYGRQNREGEVIFGGDREVVGYNKSVDAVGIEVNFGHAREILPFLGGLSISRTWAGLMPFSLDGRPIIGRMPQMENLYVVSGLASSGFGRGPMAGKLIADYIHTGHRPPVLSESDPAEIFLRLSTASDIDELGEIATTTECGWWAADFGRISRPPFLGSSPSGGPAARFPIWQGRYYPLTRARLRGRVTSSPPQFGQTCSIAAAHVGQNVHS